jgi:mono/diheme cytochrome c family protein
MRAALVGAFALGIVGCGSLGSWGSSDNGSSDPSYDDADASVPTGPGALAFGDTRQLADAPAPLSGGTLAIAAITRPSGTRRYAVAADPDRDAVHVAEIDAGTSRTIALYAGDEPGRVATDGAGTAFVALRRGGALVTIDIEGAQVTSRRNVCPAPRGVAYDRDAAVVHVACAGGELVTLPAAGGDAKRTLHLDLDLRDVVLAPGGGLYVSRFRSAEVLTLDADGKVRSRWTAPDTVTPPMQSAIAWRMIDDPAGGHPLVIHQLASRTIDNSSSAGIVPPYYSGGGPCSGSGSVGGPAPAVATALSRFDASGDESFGVPGATLPVDVAVSPSGTTFAIVAAGQGHTQGVPSLITVDASDGYGAAPHCLRDPKRTLEGQLTSVVFADDNTIVAFAREPAGLLVTSADGVGSVNLIPLGAPSREDTGHAVFHSDTGAGVACASCHAEGGDDGLVWTFAEQGRRRTPSLKGTLAGTAPYHWSGELADVPALVDTVYQAGMSGPDLAADQTSALQAWLFAIPSPAPPATEFTAVARGRALFEGAAGCATCHAGPRLTNNTTVDVGTGGSFQVPSLVGVAHRAPFLHTGCAATLADRFGSCGGGDNHGKTSTLSPADVSDLVAYLSAL